MSFCRPENIEWSEILENNVATCVHRGRLMFFVRIRNAEKQLSLAPWYKDNYFNRLETANYEYMSINCRYILHKITYLYHRIKHIPLMLNSPINSFFSNLYFTKEHNKILRVQDICFQGRL